MKKININIEQPVVDSRLVEQGERIQKAIEEAVRKRDRVDISLEEYHELVATKKAKQEQDKIINKLTDALLEAGITPEDAKYLILSGGQAPIQKMINPYRMTMTVIIGWETSDRDLIRKLQ